MFVAVKHSHIFQVGIILKDVYQNVVWDLLQVTAEVQSEICFVL